MGILLWVVFGALAGWIASMVMGTNAQQGAIANIVIGIIGAVIGGFVMSFFGGSGASGFNLYSLLVAVLGSVILIWVIRVLRR
ncbi:MAG: GlsB/YeaQ/YmgE family stress response membrane protein [Patescibacteria group bacterium]